MLARSFPLVLKAGLVAGLPFWIATAVACSGTENPSGGSSSGGSSSSGSSSGGSSSGGATSSGGRTATGGTSPSSAGASGGSSTGGSVSLGGTTTGGATGTGGASSGSGGKVEPGAPCTTNCPTGRVHSCIENCPLGACDDSGFYADEPCTTVYPSPISSQTVFCSKGQTATYCLSALDGNLFYYVVSCAAGTPTVTKCLGGCGVASDGVATCNQ